MLQIHNLLDKLFCTSAAVTFSCVVAGLYLDIVLKMDFFRLPIDVGLFSVSI